MSRLSVEEQQRLLGIEAEAFAARGELGRLQRAIHTGTTTADEVSSMAVVLGAQLASLSLERIAICVEAACRV